jgi:hypothetical protein
LIELRFEDENEDRLVADLGVISVERFATL